MPKRPARNVVELIPADSSYKLLSHELMSAAELLEESSDPEFWDDYWPDLPAGQRARAKLKTIHTDRKAEKAWSQGWVEPETFSAQVASWVTENPELRRVVSTESVLASFCKTPQAILYVGDSSASLVMTQHGGFTTYPLTLSEYDYIMLAELDSIDDPSGELWAEVAVRVSTQLSGAIAQGFAAFPEFPPKVWVVSTLAPPAALVKLVADDLDNYYLNPWPVPRGLGTSTGKKLCVKSVRKAGSTRGINLISTVERAHSNRRLSFLSAVVAAPVMALALCLIAYVFVVVAPRGAEAENIQQELADVRAQLETFQGALEAAGPVSDPAGSEIPRPSVSPDVVDARLWNVLLDPFLTEGLVDQVRIGGGEVSLLSRSPSQSMFDLVDARWRSAGLELARSEFNDEQYASWRLSQ